MYRTWDIKGYKEKGWVTYKDSFIRHPTSQQRLSNPEGPGKMSCNF